MNFTLEINKPEQGSNLGFKTIYFNAFKINIIERYTGKGQTHFYHVVIKLRTIEDKIINTIKGTGRIMLKEADYQTYSRLSKVLSSYEYRNKLINRNKVEDEFVNFILSRMVGQYQL